MNNCPICGNPIMGYPALSRKDNKTEICSDCGQREAMSQWINYQMIQKIKKDYPAGTRIELIHMADEDYPVENGMHGTVDHVDDTGTLHCIFDNGRQLGVIIGVDTFRKIKSKEDN